jgi:hypothetical protein
MAQARHKHVQYSNTHFFANHNQMQRLRFTFALKLYGGSACSALYNKKTRHD